MTKILKTGARLGKFGWDGEKGRGRGIRARLQVQSLPRGNREPQIHALGSKDTLILKTGLKVVKEGASLVAQW